MTENTMKVIKIASGVVILILMGVKVIMIKKDKKEEPATEEAAE